MKTDLTVGDAQRTHSFAAAHVSKLVVVGGLATLAGVGALLACITTSCLTRNFVAAWYRHDYGMDPHKLTMAYGCAFGAGALLLVSGVGAVVYGRKNEVRKAQVLGAIFLAAAILAIGYATALCHMKSRGTETWAIVNDDYYWDMKYQTYIRPSGHALTAWVIGGCTLVTGGLLMSYCGGVGRHHIARQTKQSTERLTTIS
jgi:hypothetical protein